MSAMHAGLSQDRLRTAHGSPSPVGSYLACPCPGRPSNRIELRRSTGELVAWLEGRWLRTVSLVFSSDRRWIAASGYIGGVMVWGVPGGAPVAFFTDIEADAQGGLPLLFARGDTLLVCGGCSLTFIETSRWTRVRSLSQPVAAMRASSDPLQVAAFERTAGGTIRWTFNLKSFDVVTAERL